MTDYRLTHPTLIKYNKARVLALATTATANRGFVTVDFIRSELSISIEDLVEIRDELISEGKIEAIP